MKNIDREYSTQERKEMFYLVDSGERYVFVKTFEDITTWKFKKTENLFRLLSKYYKDK